MPKEKEPYVIGVIIVQYLLTVCWVQGQCWEGGYSHLRICLGPLVATPPCTTPVQAPCTSFWTIASHPSQLSLPHSCLQPAAAPRPPLNQSTVKRMALPLGGCHKRSDQGYPSFLQLRAALATSQDRRAGPNLLIVKQINNLNPQKARHTCASFYWSQSEQTPTGGWQSVASSLPFSSVFSMLLYLPPQSRPAYLKSQVTLPCKVAGKIPPSQVISAPFPFGDYPNLLSCHPSGNSSVLSIGWNESSQRL